MTGRVWDIRENGDITPANKSLQQDKLSNIVYKLGWNMAGPFLTPIANKFEFNHKVYGLEDKFIRRTVNMFKQRKGNLAVILSGLKGTGKTVTAKILANEINLPTILVNENYGNSLGDFLHDIKQDVTLLFDEFEKTYKGNDKGSQDSLLSIMDGVHTTKNRVMFIMTTNNLYINENMEDRPTRVRYIKKFGDLHHNIIEEIVDDTLQLPEFREAAIDFISRLKLITVDIVKQVIEEINISGESPEEFKDFFNIKEAGHGYDIFETVGRGKNAKKKLLESGCVYLSHQKFDKGSVYDSFSMNGTYFGEITSVVDSNNAVVEKKDNKTNKTQKVTITIVKVPLKHKSFYK